MVPLGNMMADTLCFLQVRDFLGKQGRQACKIEIEKATKIAFSRSYADVLEPGELDKKVIEDLLKTGMPCLCQIGINLHTDAETLSQDPRIPIRQSKAVALTSGVPLPSYHSWAGFPLTH